MLFLGVDGGGTKTAFAIIDDKGNLLAEHVEGTCYHIEVGLEGARKVLESGVRKTLRNADANVRDITFAFFGLPAYGENSSLIAAIDNMPSGILSRNQFQCDNDMVSAWAAAFDCRDGINIVSGTGSIAYGVRGAKSARCGGWGELFGDEGSAYWVGCRGLQAFSKMSDGRMQVGPLYELMKGFLMVKRDIDISALVHSDWSGERAKIASLSSIVADAATAGDVEAQEIFTQAGRELALIVESTKRSLGYGNEEQVSASYSGGVFSAKRLILEPFKEALQKYSPQYSIEEPAFAPVIGAARYACKLSGHWSESFD